jgi:thioesterase domain-containing protein
VKHWTEAEEKISLLENENFDSPEFNERIERFLAEARRLGRLNSTITAAEARHYLRVYQANVQAAQAYVPQPYPGSLVFFRSRTRFVIQAQEIEPLTRWRELTRGEVEVYQVPCEHFQMMDEPFVQTLAEHLQGCLKKPAATR